MDMSKYRPFFLSDAAEHLEGLERELMALEQNPRETARLDEIFRHLHSLKGLSASMQYVSMSRLAHRLEDLIEVSRQKKTAPGPEHFRLLLGGVDILREQLEKVRRDESPGETPVEFLAELESLLQRTPAPGGTTLSSTAEARPQAQPAGPVWKVVLAVDRDCLAPTARAMVALKQLGRLGKVISSRPTPEQLRAGELPERTLVVELQSDCTREQLLALQQKLAEIESVQVESPQAAAAGAPVLQLPTVRVETELLDFFFDSVSELVIMLGRLENLGQQSADPRLLREVNRLGRLVRRLYQRVAEVRLVPVSLLSNRLARACRDLARSLGKQVELKIEGEEVKFDRSLIEVLDAPLLHLLRNSLGHGIETPAERRAAGKSEAGRVRVVFARAGERAQVLLEDDGAGIDEEKVKQKAAQLGITIPARRDWLWEIISRPAFSTSEKADQLSGRGVGLDAVRHAVEQAGGKVRLETQVGRGTSFFIELPLSVAIVPLLLVEEGGALLGLPASGVQRVLALQSGQKTADGRMLLGEEEFDLLELSRLLGGERRAGGEGVLLEADGRRLVLGVEHVLGYRQVVAKKPGRILGRLGPYAGTAVLGDGRPLLLLDVPQLLAAGGVR
jgi:two-component system chemotaxis sensor kinase CheA